MPINKKADKAWSEAIMARDIKCRYPDCEKRSEDPHHVIARRITKFRHDLNNGVGLCRSHHSLIEDHKVDDWQTWKVPANGLIAENWMEQGGQSNPAWPPNLS